MPGHFLSCSTRATLIDVQRLPGGRSVVAGGTTCGWAVAVNSEDHRKVPDKVAVHVSNSDVQQPQRGKAPVPYSLNTINDRRVGGEVHTYRPWAHV